MEDPRVTAGGRLDARRSARTLGPVAAVALGTLGGRVLGVARDASLARWFGASQYTDAYLTAMVLPLLLIGAIQMAVGSVVIPIGREALVREGALEARRVMGGCLVWVTILGVGVAAGAWLAARFVVHVVAPGFLPDESALAFSLARILALSIVLLMWSAVLGGVLNVCDSFALPAGVAVAQNLVIIGAIAVGGHLGQISDVAWGTVLGTFVAVVVQVVALLKKRMFPVLALRVHDRYFREVSKRIGPVTASFVVGQLGVVIGRVLASGLSPGRITDLDYAVKLQRIPGTTIEGAVGTVLLPSMTERATVGDVDGLGQTLARGTQMLTFALLPAVGFLGLCPTPLVRALFERGAFGPEAVRQVSFTVQMYAVGIIGGAMLDWFRRGFFALGDTRKPMVASMIGVGANIALNLALVGPLAQAGLALAWAVSNNVSAGLTGLWLWRSLGGVGLWNLRSWMTRLVISSAGGVAFAMIARGVAYVRGPAGYLGPNITLWMWMVGTVGYAVTAMMIREPGAVGVWEKVEALRRSGVKVALSRS